jgi:hypothetical protein
MMVSAGKSTIRLNCPGFTARVRMRVPGAAQARKLSRVPPHRLKRAMGHAPGATDADLAAQNDQNEGMHAGGEHIATARQGLYHPVQQAAG